MLSIQSAAFKKARKDIRKNYCLYIMVAPIVAFYWIFHYEVMYGAIIAFKNLMPIKGIMGSPWVGLRHFESFFSSVYFVRILRNTLMISLKNLLFGFPAPILLALLINEIRSTVFKRTVQTFSYLPYFISTMVISGIIKDFCSVNGVITEICRGLGMKTQTSMLLVSRYFQPIYIISDIWRGMGWNSIIYLAALSGIDQELYEAAKIDGAGRLRQTLHITLPGISSTIVVLLILRVGQVMNVGFEKIILLYSPNIYDVSDVISSFVYRKGILEQNYSYGAAVGLFNSSINFSLLMATNWFSKRVSGGEHSLF